MSARSSGGETDAGAARERAPEAQVRVVVQHPGMRRLIVELLERELDGCIVSDGLGIASAGDAASDDAAEVIIVDEIDLGQATSDAGPRRRSGVIVISPEPDDSYRDAALQAGVHGWLTRERVAEELPLEVSRVLEGLAIPDR